MVATECPTAKAEGLLLCKDTVNWRNNKLPKIYFSQAGQISTRHALHFAVVSVPAWGMEVFTDLIRRQGSRPWQPFYIRSDQASHPLAGRRSLYWEKMSCHLMKQNFTRIEQRYPCGAGYSLCSALSFASAYSRKALQDS